MKGKISKKWFGIRSRPDGEPSPIMKKLEDGLIICTGFYKMGFYWLPACSKWVTNEVKITLLIFSFSKYRINYIISPFAFESL